MKEQRWLRIIPVALIMYTISYIDRTNISLALDPKISTMMKDLFMDDKMKGHAAGIFFLGYVLLQIPGGFLANHWSAKKLVGILLVFWGICAVGCGLVKTFKQFEVMRFMLGVAESGVYPATLVLLATWFPRAERARANAYFNLCMPLAVAGSAPVTSWLLTSWNGSVFANSTGWANWQATLIIEGALPFVWLPIWLCFISDRPSQAKWISAEERQFLETTLARETKISETVKSDRAFDGFLKIAFPVLLMMVIYFLQNCAAYGCNTFLTSSFDRAGRPFTGLEKGLLFAVPYIVTALMMVLNSRHSDKTQERRGHVALSYGISGSCLIASVLVSSFSFWLSFAFLCFAIPGPFASLAPFWANVGETMPRAYLGVIMGSINAVGNLGGHYGNVIAGWLKQTTGGSITASFIALGSGLLIAAALCFLLPKAARASSLTAT
ncbi:MAG: MFS transporter [Verrucomicrobia bacterium]|nr:MFS transporter [Verrucomicrobiota bacterium]